MTVPKLAIEAEERARALITACIANNLDDMTELIFECSEEELYSTIGTLTSHYKALLEAVSRRSGVPIEDLWQTISSHVANQNPFS